MRLTPFDRTLRWLFGLAFAIALGLLLVYLLGCSSWTGERVYWAGAALDSASTVYSLETCTSCSEAGLVGQVSQDTATVLIVGLALKWLAYRLLTMGEVQETIAGRAMLYVAGSIQFGAGVYNIVQVSREED